MHNKYFAKNNLEELLKRLKKGMRLNGRIIDKLDNYKYILRVWNYNIYTESKKKFTKSQEVSLLVKEVYPHLIFDIYTKSKKVNSLSIDNLHHDIIVN